MRMRLIIPSILCLLLVDFAWTQGIEAEADAHLRGIELAEDLCQSDYGCKILLDSCKSEKSVEHRKIPCSALAIHILVERAKKLPQDDETKRKLQELDAVFKKTWI